ncbi:MAG: phosphatase PAP2 family protein [Clostridiales bacterium]|nr:phosphatase PAP2 family protein [Clostridiales bacterium]
MEKSKRTRLYICLAVFFAAAFVAGTFWDLPVARALYSENNRVAVIFSVLGLYLFFGSYVFLLGVLCRQLLVANSKGENGKGANGKRWIRWLILLLFVYLTLSTSALGGGGFISDSVCGFLFPEKTGSLWEYLLAGLILFVPLFPLGMLANKDRYDKTVVRRLIVLLAFMCFAFFLSSFVKSTVMRPRYRITLLGYEGVEFVPWYSLLKNSKFLMSFYDLVSDDLGSFFSGHAMNAMLNLAIISAFAGAFPKVKEKEKSLIILAIAISVPIMLSRMVLGDHYLSDVAFGALAGLKMCYSVEKVGDKAESFSLHSVKKKIIGCKLHREKSRSSLNTGLFTDW